MRVTCRLPPCRLARSWAARLRYLFLPIAALPPNRETGPAPEERYCSKDAAGAEWRGPAAGVVPWVGTSAVSPSPPDGRLSSVWVGGGS